MSEIAEMFGINRANLYKVIKNKGLRVEPFPYHYSRKDRHVGLQLIKQGEDLPPTLKTPSRCKHCRSKLTYDIYGEEPHNATVYLTSDYTVGGYEVSCKECNVKHRDED